MRPSTALVLGLLLVAAGLFLAPKPADARGRRVRPPSRARLLRALREADEKVYYLPRAGLKDLTVKFPKFTKLGWLTRKLHWKAPDRILYRLEGLPEQHAKAERAFVAQLIAEYDATLYPLVSQPWLEVANRFELSAPDPKDLTRIVLTPKEGRRTPYLRKEVRIGEAGLPVKVTTYYPGPPPTKEELEADPEFKGRDVETLTEIAYQKIGRWYFFRRVDYEDRDRRKVIVDIEKWERRGEYWLPVELTLVDPFAGSEMLPMKDISTDSGLSEEMFEGFPHRLER